MMSVKRNPSAGDLRRFGLAMLLGFGVLGVLLWWRAGWVWTGGGRQWTASTLWCVGGLLALVSLGPRRLSVPVYVGWMTGAFWIGRVVTPVMLTVLFVLVLPVFALIRLSDPLRLRLRPKGGSYWEDHRPQEHTLARMARPF